MSIYIFDTEFEEKGNKYPITPISIGIVKLDLDEVKQSKEVNIKKYYAVSSEFNEEELSDWLKENVVPILNKKPAERKTLEQIKSDILNFVGNDPDPIFMAYYADYDWVVLAQLFGSMIDLPENFPMCCIDLKQLFIHFGEPKMKEQESNQHNALSDAIHNAEKFIRLYRMVKDKDYKGQDLFKLKSIKS